MAEVVRADEVSVGTMVDWWGQRVRVTSWRRVGKQVAVGFDGHERLLYPWENLKVIGERRHRGS